MNGITAGLLSDRHDLLRVKISGGASAAQLVGFISFNDVQRFRVIFGEYSDRGQSQLGRGLRHTNGNFAAISN
jgi:hypothetical protein